MRSFILKLIVVLSLVTGIVTSIQLVQANPAHAGSRSGEEGSRRNGRDRSSSESDSKKKDRGKKDQGETPAPKPEPKKKESTKTAKPKEKDQKPKDKPKGDEEDCGDQPTPTTVPPTTAPPTTVQPTTTTTTTKKETTTTTKPTPPTTAGETTTTVPPTTTVVDNTTSTTTVDKAVPAPVENNSTPSGTLPTTGAPTIAFVLAALALILFGMLLVPTSRRWIFHPVRTYFVAACKVASAYQAVKRLVNGEWLAERWIPRERPAFG